MYAEIVLKSSKADTDFDYSKIYLPEFEIMPKLCLKGELACAEILVQSS